MPIIALIIIFWSPRICTQYTLGQNAWKLSFQNNDSCHILQFLHCTQNTSILVFGSQLLDSIDLGVFNCANWNLCNNNVFLKHWTPGLWSFSPRPLHLNKYKSTYHNAYIIINSKYCRISIGSWEEILEKGNTYFHSLKTLSPWRMNFTGTNLNLLFLIKTSKVPCNWEQF